jgi:hypothetical protein
MQAFEGLITEMGPLVKSTKNPWIHTVYTWACAQQLSIRMHMTYMDLNSTEVSVCIATLAHMNLCKCCCRTTGSEGLIQAWMPFR